MIAVAPLRPASWLLAGLLAAAPLHAQPSVDPRLAVEQVASGLALPTTMGFVAPGDILVLEKNTGRVRRVLDGALQAQPVLDLPVNGAGERGLLGIAVNSELPPRVFLYFTEAVADGGTVLGNRVDRYDWNPGSGLLENPQRILELPAGIAAQHHGGVLALGPPGEIAGGLGDGAALYAVIGDVSRQGQLQNVASGPPPDDTSVILRVDQTGAPAPGNPFAPYCSATPSRTCSADFDCPAGEDCITRVARYYAYGIRNSFGLALDPVTGALWGTENGPASHDEINRVAAGFNSGWRQVMGPVANPPPPALFQMPGVGEGYRNPAFSWLDTNAPTAILFPDGSALGPAFDGSALVADNNAGQIYAFPLDATREGFDFGDFPALQDRVADDDAERDLLAIGGGFGAVTDLEVGPDGAVYVVSIAHGALYRLPEPALPLGLAAGGALLAALAGPRSRRR